MEQSADEFTTEWLDIYGYEGYYKINKNGDVKSIERIITRSNETTQKFKSKLLSQYISSNGYKSVSLTKNGKTRMYNIHSLLGLTFMNKQYIKLKLVINHKDGDKLNNNLCNLEIVTYSQNNQHSVLNKLNNPRKRKNTKVNDKALNEILIDLKNKNYTMQKDLCKKYEISTSYLSQLKNKKRGVINFQKNY